MDLIDLTPEENLALIGLLKAVIQADKLYSMKESAELARIAKHLGEETFHQTVEVARVQFKSLASIKAYAQTITRQPAREWIYGTVVAMARSDTLTAEEGSLLDWLADLWEIRDLGNEP